ncbi:SDR family oxidoreductase [Aquamicrobium soli]|uniref:SDR family oxidoreductase n=1 Tax=Aquamicrobium soli TaxID=1811518 RepID=A0ABV7K538_9HYPH
MTARPGLALVTGASSGIGRATSIALAAAGYQVLALARSEGALAELATTPGIRPVVQDVTDIEKMTALLAPLELDVLVNNAGIMPAQVTLAEMTQADIDRAFAVNVAAAITVTRLTLPGMMARRKGHIFFMGSTAGHAPFPKMAVYGATKAAIASLAASLRCEVAGSGVRITELVAGRVQTELYRDVLDPRTRSEMYAAFDAVQPEDVARMLVSVLEMPPAVNVSRFDILPTAQYVGGGGFARKES